MNNIDKNLIVISGPSGCGKDTVVKKILELDPRFVLSVSATTRPRRPIETDMVDYIFLTTQGFIQKISDGEFLEHTLYCNNYYGTLKSQISEKVSQGYVVVLVIEVEGAQNVKKVYPNALTVFLAPPSLEELERRLRSRNTEDDNKIQQRLYKANEELGFKSSYDYIVENNSVEQCAKSIIDIYNEHINN